MQINDLPAEALTLVLSFLEVKDLAQVNLVSQQLRKAVADDKLWKGLYKRDFPNSYKGRIATEIMGQSRYTQDPPNWQNNYKAQACFLHFMYHFKKSAEQESKI
ncbi:MULTISPECIES: F-box protein [Parachlamydia]|jgi:hypothetical protein|uniref:F-box domain-containing protein n=2 Tax=Parachlamydia acanthamoebae TaxID=83552 RepID=F8KWM5_PARAV|nr:F-box protein [Parachlamydia acanthamoebae]EFB40361.1 hypothetical protein pah_c207o055 [Parachlamydia acanthamoebae str. Hall's coccus]KIA76102.1 hypothetical protein DB43_AU00090 [Parachlamydia acanthamoebae]CCB85433.1 putative uncharacterized protein [Parachlamydia acanthamoebae UV-7]